MILVRITPAMREAAAYREARILGTDIEDHENYTRLVVPNRYRDGFVGEHVIKQTLCEQHKRFIYHVYFDGRSHGQDFTVYRASDGRPLKLDVKTRPKPNARSMLTPAAQFDLHKNDLYVAVRLRNRQIAEVIGWLTRVEYARCPRVMLRCWTIACEYHDLRDLDDLFINLQNGTETNEEGAM